jgi:chromosome segregation ATPase
MGFTPLQSDMISISALQQLLKDPKKTSELIDTMKHEQEILAKATAKNNQSLAATEAVAAENRRLLAEVADGQRRLASDQATLDEQIKAHDEAMADLETKTIELRERSYALKAAMKEFDKKDELYTQQKAEIALGQKRLDTRKAQLDERARLLDERDVELEQKLSKLREVVG